MTTHAPRGAFRNVTESHAFGRVDLYGSNGLRLVGFPLDVVRGLEQELEADDGKGIVHRTQRTDSKGEQTAELILLGKPWLNDTISTDILITVIFAHLHRHSFAPTTILPVGPKSASSIHVSISWSRSLRHIPNSSLSSRSAFAITFPSASAIRIVGAPSQDEEAILRQIRHAWGSDVKEERALSDGCFEIQLKSRRRSLFSSSAQTSEDTPFLIDTLVQYLDGRGHRLIVSFSYYSKSASPDFFLFDCLDTPIRAEASVPFPTTGTTVARRERRVSLPTKAAAAAPAKLSNAKGPPTTQATRRRTWSWSFGRRQKPPDVFGVTEVHTATTTQTARPADDWQAVRPPSIMGDGTIYDRQAAVATESVVKRSVRSPSIPVGEIFPSELTSPATTVNALQGESSKGKAKDSRDAARKAKQGIPKIEIEDVEDVQSTSSNANGFGPITERSWADDTASATTAPTSEYRKGKNGAKTERRISKETAQSVTSNGEGFTSIHQTVEQSWGTTDKTNGWGGGAESTTGWGAGESSTGWGKANDGETGWGGPESMKTASEWVAQSNTNMASPPAGQKESQPPNRAPGPKPPSNGQPVQGPVKSPGSQQTKMVNGHQPVANAVSVPLPVGNTSRLVQTPTMAMPSRKPATRPRPIGPYDIWTPSDDVGDMHPAAPSAPLPGPNSRGITQVGAPNPKPKMWTYASGGAFGPPTPPPPEEVERLRREREAKRLAENDKQKKAWEQKEWAARVARQVQIDKQQQLTLQARGSSVARFEQQFGQPLPFGAVEDPYTARAAFGVSYVQDPRRVPVDPYGQDRRRGPVDPYGQDRRRAPVDPYGQDPRRPHVDQFGRQQVHEANYPYSPASRGSRKVKTKDKGGKNKNANGRDVRWPDDAAAFGYPDAEGGYGQAYDYQPRPSVPQQPHGILQSYERQPKSPGNAFASLAGFNVPGKPGLGDKGGFPNATSIQDIARAEAMKRGLATGAAPTHQPGRTKTGQEIKAERDARVQGDPNGYPMYGNAALTQESMLAQQLNEGVRRQQGRGKDNTTRSQAWQWSEYAEPSQQNGNGRAERGRSRERGNKLKKEDGSQWRRDDATAADPYSNWTGSGAGPIAYPGTTWDTGGTSHAQPYTSSAPVGPKEPSKVMSFFKGLGRNKRDKGPATVEVHQKTTSATAWPSSAAWEQVADDPRNGDPWKGNAAVDKRGAKNKSKSGGKADKNASAWGGVADSGGWGGSAAYDNWGTAGEETNGARTADAWGGAKATDWGGFAETSNWGGRGADHTQTIRHTGKTAQPALVASQYREGYVDDVEDELYESEDDYDDYGPEEDEEGALGGFANLFAQQVAQAGGRSAGRTSPVMGRR